MNKANNMLEHPLVHIVVGSTYPECKKTGRCTWYENQMQEKLVGKYIGLHKPFKDQTVAAWLPLLNLDCGLLEKRMRKHSKAAAIRQAKKATEFGYCCLEINPKKYVKGIVSVNTSAPIRAGKLMTAPYKRDVDQLTRDMATGEEFQTSTCNLHWDRWWGVFNYERKSLAGYARIRRNGNYILYAQWLGHRDHLKKGAMHLLHKTIILWLLDQTNEQVKGVENAIYAAWHSGDGGLQRWKVASGFEPALLILDNTTSE